MKAWRFLMGEFHYIFSDWKRAIPVVAILFIPILYAGVYLFAFWNPYGHTDQLPVAVVNEDRGTEWNGTHLSIGDRLEATLRDNHDLKWQFVSKEEAENGLEADRYYMMLEIPSGFSKQAVDSLRDPDVAEPRIVAVTNDRYNYIAAQMTRTAMDKIKTQTSQDLTKEYAAQLLDNVSELTAGLGQAGDGAQRLADGASALAAKSGGLTSGAGGLTDGAGQLAATAEQAKAGARELAAGSSSAADGAGKLTDSLGRLAEAGGGLAQGANQSLDGAKKLQQGMDSSAEAADRTAAGAAQLAAGLRQYAAAHPEAAADPGFQSLADAGGKLAQGAQQLAVADQALAAGADQAVQGQGQLAGGLQRLAGSLRQAQAGAGTLKSGLADLAAGGTKLDHGLDGIAGGAQRLAQGAAKLDSGVSQYADGVSQLSAGAGELAGRLNAGAGQASGGIDKEHLADVLADPIGLTERDEGHVDNYGTGFAPYFLSLGLFVGALLMSIVIDFRTPMRRPGSPVAWFIGKFALLGTVSVLQAVIADEILLHGVGLEVQSVPHFIGFSILTGLSFTAIIQFLVTSMANPGRFIAVILLILQLTSSSGTYPNVLTPAFFQRAAAWLPMTYSVSGFRHMISGGDAAILQGDIRHLLGYIAVFAALSLAYFAVAHVLYHRGKPEAAASQAV